MTEIDCVLSVSFRLDITTGRLAQLLEATRESTSIAEAAELGILPQAFLGMSDGFSLAQFDNLTFEYFPDRFILRATGDSNDLTRFIIHMSKKLVEKGYQVEEAIRFVELELKDVVILGTPLDVIRSKVRIDELESLRGIIGEELHPYAISVSGEGLPNTDSWLNVHLRPDPLSPNRIGLLSIVKRTNTLDKMLEFLGNFRSLIDVIGTSYVGAS